MWFPRFLLINLGKAHFFFWDISFYLDICVFISEPQGHCCWGGGRLHLILVFFTSLPSPMPLSKVPLLRSLQLNTLTVSSDTMSPLQDAESWGGFSTARVWVSCLCPHIHGGKDCAPTHVWREFCLSPESHSHGNFSKNRKDVTMISNFKKDKCLPDCENDK